MAGFGLRLAKSQGMAGFTGNLDEFAIDPADTNVMYPGDVVTLSSGKVTEASGNTPGAITGNILGVFQGWRERAADGTLGPIEKIWTGATGSVSPVALIAQPSNGVLFHVKGSAALTDAAPGNRYNLLYAAPDTTYGRSRVSINVGGGVQAAGNLIIHRLVEQPGNAWTNSEPLVEVALMRQQAHASVVA